VCHGVPYIIDKTPPTFEAVYNFAYTGGVASCRIDAYDNQSDIREVDFGLGRTRYDTLLLSLVPYPWNAEHYVAHPLTVADGTEMWAIVKLTNNVDYETMGTSKGPLLIDSSPPVCGEVGDGEKWFADITYQKSSSTLCVNWDGFSDPDSGISEYVNNGGAIANPLSSLAPELAHPPCVVLESRITALVLLTIFVRSPRDQSCWLGYPDHIIPYYTVNDPPRPMCQVHRHVRQRTQHKRCGGCRCTFPLGTRLLCGRPVAGAQ